MYVNPFVVGIITGIIITIIGVIVLGIYAAEGGDKN